VVPIQRLGPGPLPARWALPVVATLEPMLMRAGRTLVSTALPMSKAPWTPMPEACLMLRL